MPADAQLFILGGELLVEPGDVLVGEQQELLQPRHLGSGKERGKASKLAS